MTAAVPVGGSGPIKDVREGMTVMDSDGEKVGSVDHIRMGDPQAATAAGQERDSGLFGDLVSGDLPDEDLTRVGYVKIDATGVFSGSVYARADQVGTVEGGVVHLAVGRESLQK